MWLSVSSNNITYSNNTEKSKLSSQWHKKTIPEISFLLIIPHWSHAIESHRHCPNDYQPPILPRKWTSENNIVIQQPEFYVILRYFAQCILSVFVCIRSILCSEVTSYIASQLILSLSSSSLFRYRCGWRKVAGSEPIRSIAVGISLNALPSFLISQKHIQLSNAFK